MRKRAQDKQRKGNEEKETGKIKYKDLRAIRGRGRERKTSERDEEKIR